MRRYYSANPAPARRSLPETIAEHQRKTPVPACDQIVQWLQDQTAPRPTEAISDWALRALVLQNITHPEPDKSAQARAASLKFIVSLELTELKKLDLQVKLNRKAAKGLINSAARSNSIVVANSNTTTSASAISASNGIAIDSISTSPSDNSNAAAISNSIASASETATTPPAPRQTLRAAPDAPSDDVATTANSAAIKNPSLATSDQPTPLAAPAIPSSQPINPAPAPSAPSVVSLTDQPAAPTVPSTTNSPSHSTAATLTDPITASTTDSTKTSTIPPTVESSENAPPNSAAPSHSEPTKNATFPPSNNSPTDSPTNPPAPLTPTPPPPPPETVDLSRHALTESDALLVESQDPKNPPDPARYAIASQRFVDYFLHQITLAQNQEERFWKVDTHHRYLQRQNTFFRHHPHLSPTPILSTNPAG